MPLNFAYNWLSCFRNDETTPGCVAGASFYCVCWGGRGRGGEGGGGHHLSTLSLHSTVGFVGQAPHS